jgi:creatinine amidohydrolase
MLELTRSSWNQIDSYIRSSEKPTAIIVLSPIEEHASHLPCGTDYLIAEEISKEVAIQMEDCVLFPTIPLMCCGISKDTTGTYPISGETLKGIVRDLITELYRKGFKKIVILSVHGGYSHILIREVINEIEKSNSDKNTICIARQFPRVTQQATVESKRDMHAGWIETSLMLYLFPDLVADELPPADYHEKEQGVLSKSGIDGDPQQASYQKGKDLFDLIVSETLAWVNSYS